MLISQKVVKRTYIQYIHCICQKGFASSTIWVVATILCIGWHFISGVIAVFSIPIGGLCWENIDLIRR